MRLLSETLAQLLSARDPETIVRGLFPKVAAHLNVDTYFHFLVDDLAELLVAKYGVASVVKHRKRTASIPAPEAIVADIVRQCDLVITGSGD